MNYVRIIVTVPNDFYFFRTQGIPIDSAGHKTSRTFFIVDDKGTETRITSVPLIGSAVADDIALIDLVPTSVTHASELGDGLWFYSKTLDSTIFYLRHDIHLSLAVRHNGDKITENPLLVVEASATEFDCSHIFFNF